jgi:hypothetical protein
MTPLLAFGRLNGARVGIGGKDIGALGGIELRSHGPHLETSRGRGVA